MKLLLVDACRNSLAGGDRSLPKIRLAVERDAAAGGEAVLAGVATGPYSCSEGSGPLILANSLGRESSSIS